LGKGNTTYDLEKKRQSRAKKKRREEKRERGGELSRPSGCSKGK